MSSLESFDRKYETETKDVVIRGRRFSVLVPRTLDRFVDPHDIFNNFARANAQKNVHEGGANLDIKELD
jgi:hypothetical protein